LKLSLTKPNKSSQYYQLVFEGSIGTHLFYYSPVSNNFKDEPPDSTTICLCKSDLKQLKQFLQEKVKG